MSKKLRVSALALAAVLVLIVPALAADPLAIGASIPMSEVKMKSVSGEMVAIDDLKGDAGTLVIFTCNHCPYVKKWEERTVALGNKALEKGMRVIAINSNDPGHNAGDGYEGMVERAKKAGMNYHYVVDEGSKLAKAYGASRTPEVFLFDASGELVYHGAVDDNVEADKASTHHLKNAIMAVSKGEKVDEAQTKAIGCSIKFYS